MKRVKLHLLESGWEFVVRSAAAELLASFQRDQKFIKNSVMVVDWTQQELSMQIYFSVFWDRNIHFSIIRET